MNSFSSMISANWSENFLKLTKIQKSKEQKELEWEEKAIKSLEKKLEQRPSVEGGDALKTLKLVLERQCANSPCITVNRTQDGRVQIGGRKMYPHYAYCKIYRWRDLENHNELKPLNNYCSKSFQNKQEKQVCVNPYHYERVKASVCAASPSESYNQNSFSNASFSSSFDEQSFMNHCDQSNNSMNQSLNDQSMSQSYYLKRESPISPSPSTQQFDYSNSNSQFNQINYNQINYNQINLNHININQIDSTYDLYMEAEKNSGPTFQNATAIQATTYSNTSPSVNWCSVVFFEYKNRLDKRLISSDQHIISGVDLPKYLHRNEGIRLHNNNGQVFIESNCKVFIQSPFLNLLNNIDLKSVIELETGLMKVFDENLFEQMIINNCQGGLEALHSLIKLTNFTLSFTYSWGKNIEISQRPCWLEITMDRAVGVLAKPLYQYRPLKQTTSVS